MLPVSHAKIIFVSSSGLGRQFRHDPGFIYRCESPGLYLASLGHEVHFKHLTQIRESDPVDLVVFHRPRASFRLRRLLTGFRKKGVACLADFDDLVFDPGIAKHSPGVLNGLNSLLVTREKFRLHRIALSWFSTVSVSTRPLALRVKALFPAMRVVLAHNSIHWSWHRLAPGAGASRSCKRVLAYLPGTRSHDRDFALVAGPLRRFLLAYPDSVLRVTGPIQFQLDVPEGQVIHAGRVPFSDYAACFSDVWLNLSPLEATPFNACKSGLKVMEAAYMGVPTLSTFNEDAHRLGGAGAVIADHAQWYEALVRLRDKAYYQNLTDGLRSRVLPLASLEAQVHGLLDAISMASGRAT